MCEMNKLLNFLVIYLQRFLDDSCCRLQTNILELEEALVHSHQVVVDLGQVALDGPVGCLGLHREEDRGGAHCCLAVGEAGRQSPDIQPDGGDVVPE